jgi:hypothetical protein
MITPVWELGDAGGVVAFDRQPPRIESPLLVNHIRRRVTWESPVRGRTGIPGLQWGRALNC